MPKKKLNPFEKIAPVRVPLMCATAGCPYDAIVRVKTNKLWLNLCHSCDDKRVHKANLEWCLERGLDTPEKQRAYCREILSKEQFKSRAFTKLRQAVAQIREPGQDDEEIGLS